MFILNCEGEKKRILEFTLHKFLREGFYKTTMDEIASELKISKKTIYKYFSSKDKLIDEVIHTVQRTAKTNIEEISNSDMDALDKFLKLKSFLTSLLIKLNQFIIKDMEQHAQDKWEKIDKFRTDLIQKNVLKIIEQGKKEKIFRGFNSKVVITMLLGSLREVVSPTYIINSNFSAHAGATMVYNFFLAGMLTEKGKKLLNKYKESLEYEE
ncbi:MAG: TetR/AcrR family transcriptional regulator [Ignavibacteria bacterium]|jgi:AcrR family transcriptional regulator